MAYTREQWAQSTFGTAYAFLTPAQRAIVDYEVSTGKAYTNPTGATVTPTRNPSGDKIGPGPGGGPQETPGQLLADQALANGGLQAGFNTAAAEQRKGANPFDPSNWHIPGLGWADALGKILSDLLSPIFWEHVAFILGGLILVIIGVKVWLHESA